MALVRWDPFSDIDTMFNRLAPPSLWSWPRISRSENGDSKLAWSPSANISETDKEYTIRAELPAVKKEDVHVTVDGGMITIAGERKQQKEEKNERFHRVESLYGSFTRSFSLPENAEATAIKCDSKDGVLTIHIPKKGIKTQKPVEIKVQ